MTPYGVCIFLTMAANVLSLLASVCIELLEVCCNWLLTNCNTGAAHRGGDAQQEVAALQGNHGCMAESVARDVPQHEGKLHPFCFCPAKTFGHAVGAFLETLPVT